MALRLQLSDSEETLPFIDDEEEDFYVDEEEEEYDEDALVLHIPQPKLQGAPTLEDAIDAFINSVITQATSAPRVIPPAKYAFIGNDGLRARVVPEKKGSMHGLRLIDLIFTGMFVSEASKRLLFMRLQQELLRTVLSDHTRLSFVQVSDPLLQLRPIFEGLYEWTLVEEDPNRYWEFSHPAHTFFNTADLPIRSTLTDVEKMLVASQNDRIAYYQPSIGLEIHVETSAFVHLPAQDAQYQDDFDESTPPYIRNHEEFRAVFERIAAHCRALGNAELARDRDLVVVSITKVIADSRLDPYEARVLLAFLARLGRIYMRPLFVEREVFAALMEATEGAPFELLGQPRPLFERLEGEDFYYWVPDKRLGSAAHPHVIEDDSDDDEKGRDQKRRRLDAEGSYKCANCQGRPRFFATFLPMCSFKCHQQYYMYS